MMLGDLNARVSSIKNSQIIGSYGEEDWTRCKQQGLRILNGFLDTRVYRDLEYGSDHYLVAAEIYLPSFILNTQNTHHNRRIKGFTNKIQHKKTTEI